mgnify:CR=1 FL=1
MPQHVRRLSFMGHSNKREDGSQWRSTAEAALPCGSLLLGPEAEKSGERWPEDEAATGPRGYGTETIAHDAKPLSQTEDRARGRSADLRPLGVQPMR